MSDHYADPGYFDRLYARDPDPWGFETSAYERDKYAATLAALPQPRFATAFEAGCSIGVLTRRLAERCDSLLAADLAEAALDRARARCAGLDHVRFARLALPQDWPEGPFDLILLSEVLYFLPGDGIERAARRTVDTLAPGGTTVLVNWMGPTGGVCDGEVAAQRFIDAAALPRIAASQAPKYRLDVLRKEPS
jgi:cyclopropane fatty-acyl-phospholipid synthase-like methyltransferase